MSGNKADPILSLLAGSIAGGIEGTVIYPTEFVKTQLQLGRVNTATGAAYYDGPYDCLRKTVKSRGVAGLYNGLSSLVVGSFMKAGVRFSTYDAIKDTIIGDEKPTPGVSFVCGLAAGVAEAIIAVTPSETLKTKIIHDRNQPAPRFRGLVHATRVVITEEGIRGLYAGLTPTIAKQGLNQASRFVVYNAIMNHYHDKNKPGWLVTVAGAVAGAMSVYITMPFDVAKTRMQGLDKHKYTSMIHCLREIRREEGLKAYWRGSIPRLGRVSSSSSITFFCYEEIMKLFKVMQEKKVL